MWHGFFSPRMCVWAYSNWLTIVMEKILVEFYKTPFYKNALIKFNFSANMNFRLKALIGTHILMLQILSSIFFCTKFEIAYLLVQVTYTSGIWYYGYFFLHFYCQFNIGEFFKRFDKNSKKVGILKT